MPSSSPRPRILFNRDGVVVVDKPPGLPSTGRSLDDPDCVQGWLMGQLKRRKVWAVHQLDTDTTGLNLFVLRKPLVPQWGALLSSGQKTYLALVKGRWDQGRLRVEAPIGRRRVDGRWWPCLGGEGAKAAVSTISAVDTGSRASLVSCAIETGRSHQVRLHLLSAGHPILGERQHLTPPDTSVGRCMLHAWRLALPGAPRGFQELEAVVPADLRAAAVAAGLSLPS